MNQATKSGLDLRNNAKFLELPLKSIDLFIPLKFHEELLKKRLLKLKRGETYNDFKIRCNVELHRNQKYFQPKGWSVEKLLYNYDLFFHFGSKAEKVNDELTDLLKEHCEFLYKKYRVNIKDRIPHG